MPASRFRSLIDTLFPSSDATIERSQFVQESLRSLRMVRDERALLMGTTQRIPSRYQLRISAEQFDQLKGVHAIRDLEIFLTDQLMKEASTGGMRTFGDHLLRVTIASDDALTSGEIYTAVLSPEAKPTAAQATPRVPLSPIEHDATRVIGQPGPSEQLPAEPSPILPPALVAWRIVVEWEGRVIANAELSLGQWVVGRRGTPQTPIPGNYRTLELDVRETVSRQQLRLEVHEDWVVVEQIGKGRASLGENDPLRPGFPRTVLPGAEFQLEDYTIRFQR